MKMISKLEVESNPRQEYLKMTKMIYLLSKKLSMYLLQIRRKIKNTRRIRKTRKIRKIKRKRRRVNLKVNLKANQRKRNKSHL